MSPRPDAEANVAGVLQTEAGDEPSAHASTREPSYSLLDEIVELSTAPGAASQPASAAAPALRVARVVDVDGRRATLVWRGATSGKVIAEIPPEVEPEVVRRAVEDHEAVLVEVVEGKSPVVVAVLATRVPRNVYVRGETIHVEAERELLLRAGRAALRLREDGDVEIVGSRISAASRGLFRLVGRILRLN